jgi:hypothetical protein
MKGSDHGINCICLGAAEGNYGKPVPVQSTGRKLSLHSIECKGGLLSTKPLSGDLTTGTTLCEQLLSL